MSRPVFVHLLPTLFDPADLRGGVAVVIDVLRASTTICHALAAGANGVVPCRTVEQARKNAAAAPAGSALLGGERRGVRIEGFDLGNGPADYTPAAVAGKTVVFTTTNGTFALDRSREADAVLVGAFVNLNALLQAVGFDVRPLHLVCAGTDGAVTAEDALFAGALADLLFTFGQAAGNDSATLAAGAWNGAVREGSDRPTAVWLADALRDSRGGRNLTALGMGTDILLAAAVDAVPVLPLFDPKTDRIVLKASGEASALPVFKRD